MPPTLRCLPPLRRAALWFSDTSTRRTPRAAPTTLLVDVARYFDWYQADGIFFDQAAVSCAELETFFASVVRARQSPPPVAPGGAQPWHDRFRVLHDVQRCRGGVRGHQPRRTATPSSRNGELTTTRAGSGTSCTTSTSPPSTRSCNSHGVEEPAGCRSPTSRWIPHHPTGISTIVSLTECCGRRC